MNLIISNLGLFTKNMAEAGTLDRELKLFKKLANNYSTSVTFLPMEMIVIFHISKNIQNLILSQFINILSMKE